MRLMYECMVISTIEKYIEHQFYYKNLHFWNSIEFFLNIYFNFFFHRGIEERCPHIHRTVIESSGASGSPGETAAWEDSQPYPAWPGYARTPGAAA